MGPNGCDWFALLKAFRVQPYHVIAYVRIFFFLARLNIPGFSTFYVSFHWSIELFQSFDCCELCSSEQRYTGYVISCCGSSGCISGIGTSSWYGHSSSHFSQSCLLLPQWLYHCIIPLATHKDSSFSTSSPTLVGLPSSQIWIFHCAFGHQMFLFIWYLLWSLSFLKKWYFININKFTHQVLPTLSLLSGNCCLISMWNSYFCVSIPMCICVCACACMQTWKSYTNILWSTLNSTSVTLCLC